MSCCQGGFPGASGGITPGQAQAGIAVVRTTDLELDGTIQIPTFDTVIKADTLGKFSFTPGTTTITITETGSYRISLYGTTRNESAFTFRATVMNNGVEIPNIQTVLEEGTDQAGPDEYQFCISIEAIDLTAGSLQIVVQEVTRSGSGTNLVTPNLVWSIAQNSGVAGAPGAPGDNGFSRDEFLVYLDTDTVNMPFASTVKNIFKNAAQTASKMVVLFDAGGVVDATNAKVVLTEGTWELSLFVRLGNLESGDEMLAALVEDPDGAATVINEGTYGDRASDGQAASMVSTLIKVSAGEEFGFYGFSDDGQADVIGGMVPLRTYAYGHRINTSAV